MVPCVPTGMNTGVSTSPCRNVIIPTRALVVPHFAITLYFNGGSASGVCAAFATFAPFVIVDAIRLKVKCVRTSLQIDDEHLKNKRNFERFHCDLDLY